MQSPAAVARVACGVHLHAVCAFKKCYRRKDNSLPSAGSLHHRCLGWPGRGWAEARSWGLREPWPAAPGVWNRVELGLTREPRDVACGCLTDMRLSTCLTGRLKGVRTAWRQGWGSLCQVCSREAKVVKSTQPTLSTRHACVMPGMPSRGRKRGPA